MTNPEVVVTTSAGVKCPRCWHYHYVSYNFDYLCDRCCYVILENFPDHESVAEILEAYRQQRIRWNLPEPKEGTILHTRMKQQQQGEMKCKS